MTGKREIFKVSDKINLVHRQISRQMDLGKLEKYGIIDQCFPLHDEFNLTGDDYLQSNESINQEEEQIDLVIGRIT